MRRFFPRATTAVTMVLGMALGRDQHEGRLEADLLVQAVTGGRRMRGLALALQWMPEQPDRYGQKWNVQVVVSPVLPKLIKGNLIDPRHMTFGLGR